MDLCRLAGVLDLPVALSTCTYLLKPIPRLSYDDTVGTWDRRIELGPDDQFL